MDINNNKSDYGVWKFLAWCGPACLVIFLGSWGILAQNFPPVGADLSPLEIAAHYRNNNIALVTGLSIAILAWGFYYAWGAAIAQVIRRVDGPDSILANLEAMGATITAVCPLIACAIWVTIAVEASILAPETIHAMYFMGWVFIDMTYIVTSFQLLAVSIAFLRDSRERPLIPAWACWWGFFTCVSWFPLSLISFFKTGPFAFHGLFNFWVAFGTYFSWSCLMSIFIIKAVSRLQREEAALVAQ